jgi:CHAT domain-containing protein
VSANSAAHYLTNPIRVATGINSTLAPSVTKRDGSIVYSLDNDGNTDLWKMPVAGGKPSQITLHPAEDFSATYSPNGKFVAFVSRRDDAAGDIHIKRVGGFSIGSIFAGEEGEVMRVEHRSHVDSGPQWFPDNSTVIFDSTSRARTFLYTAKVGDLRAQPLANLEGAQPSVSPSGKKVAFSRRGGIFVYDIELEQLTNVLPEGAPLEGYPRFSGSDDQMIVQRYLDDTNGDRKVDIEDNATLWRVDLTTKALTPLTSATFYALEPVIHSDRIFFSMRTNKQFSVFQLPIAGQLVGNIDQIDANQYTADDRVFIHRMRRAAARASDRSVGIWDATIDEMLEFERRSRLADAQLLLSEMKSILDTEKAAILELLVQHVELLAFRYPDSSSALTRPQTRRLRKLEEHATVLINSTNDEIRDLARLLLAEIIGTRRDLAKAATQLAAIKAKAPYLSSLVVTYQTIVSQHLLHLAAKDVSLPHKTTLLVSEALAATFDKHFDNEGSSAISERMSASSAAWLHLKLAERATAHDQKILAANEYRRVLAVSKMLDEPALRAVTLMVEDETLDEKIAAEALREATEKCANPNTCAQVRDLSARYFVRKANQLRASGNETEAKVLLSTLRTLDPDNLAAVRGLIEIQEPDLSEEKVRVLAKEKPSETLQYALASAILFSIRTIDSEGVSRAKEALAILDTITRSDPLVHIAKGWANEYLYRSEQKELEQGRGYIARKLRIIHETFNGQFDYLKVALDQYAIAQYLALPGSHEQAMALQNLANAQHELGNYEKALTYYAQRIALLEKFPTGGRRVEGTIYWHAGRSAYFAKEFKLAEALLAKSLRIWESLDDLPRICQVIDIYALAQSEAGNINLALDSYRRLLALQLETGAKSNTVVTRFNIARLLVDKKDFRGALAELSTVDLKDYIPPKPPQSQYSITQALGTEVSHVDGFGSDYFQAAVLSLRARAHEGLGLVSKAIDLQKERIELLVNNKAPTEEVCLAWHKLGSLQYGTGKFPEAVESFQSARELAKQLNTSATVLATPLELGILINEGVARLQVNDKDHSGYLAAAGPIIESPPGEAEAKNAELRRAYPKLLVVVSELRKSSPGPVQMKEALAIVDSKEQGFAKALAIFVAATPTTDLRAQEEEFKKIVAIQKNPSEDWRLALEAGDVEQAFSLLEIAFRKGLRLKNLSELARLERLIADSPSGTSDESKFESAQKLHRLRLLNTLNALKFQSEEARLAAVDRFLPVTLDNVQSTLGKAVLIFALSTHEQRVEYFRITASEVEAKTIERGTLIPALQAEPAGDSPVYIAISSNLFELPFEQISSIRPRLAFVADPGALVRFVERLRLERNTVTVVRDSNTEKNRNFDATMFSTTLPRVFADNGSNSNLVIYDTPIRAFAHSGLAGEIGIGESYPITQVASHSYPNAAILLFNQIQGDKTAATATHSILPILAEVSGTATILAPLEPTTPKIDSKTALELRAESIGEFAQKHGFRTFGFLGLSRQKAQEVCNTLRPDLEEKLEQALDDEEWTVAYGHLSTLLFCAFGEQSEELESRLKQATEVLFANRQFELALTYQAAFANLGKTDDEKALRLMDCGILALRANLEAAAADFLRQAEKGVPARTAARGKLFVNIAILAERQGRYADAISAFETAAREYQAADERETAGQRLLDIANIRNLRLSDFEGALQQYSLAEAALAEFPDSLIRAQIDHADLLRRIGEVDASLALLTEKTLPKIDRGANPKLWIRTNQNIANCYFTANLYEKAVAALDEIDKLMVESKVEDKGLEIDSKNLRAMILGRQGQISEAVNVLEANLTLARDAKLSTRVSLTLNNLGYWKRESGAIDAAISHLSEALAIDTQEDRRIDAAYDKRNLGLTKIVANNLVEAEQLLLNALKESDALRSPYNSIYSHFGLGEVNLRRGKLEEASDHFVKGAELAKKNYQFDLHWRAEFAVASVLAKMGNVDRALTHLVTVERLVTNARGGIPPRGGRGGLLAESGLQDFYDLYISLLHQKGDAALSWQTHLAARHRLFFDAVERKDVTDFGLPQSLAKELQAERSARSRLALNSLRENAGQVVGDASSRKAEYQAAVKTLLAKSRTAIPFLPPREIEVRSLLQPGDLLISYRQVAGKLLGWIVTTTTQSTFSVEVSQQELIEMSAKLTNLAENFSDIAPQLRQLSELLMSSWQQELTTANSLLLDADASLGQIPFAALPLKGGESLIDRLPISYLDSPIFNLFDRGQAPILTRSAPVLSVGVNRTKEFSDLNLAEKEAQVAKRFFPSAAVLIGSAATAKGLSEEAKRAAAIHVAAHAAFSRSDPMQSQLLLGESSTISVSDIMKLQTPAQLVILSACRTATDPSPDLASSIGVQQAFRIAGASNIMTTIWRVSDVGSAVATKNFFRFLARGESFAAALRHAQIATRKHFSHPGVWASQRLMGIGG